MAHTLRSCWRLTAWTAHDEHGLALRVEVLDRLCAAESCELHQLVQCETDFIRHELLVDCSGAWTVEILRANSPVRSAVWQPDDQEEE